MICSTCPGRGRDGPSGTRLQPREESSCSRLTSCWVPGPTAPPTAATALSVVPGMCGQPRVTPSTSRSQVRTHIRPLPVGLTQSHGCVSGASCWTGEQARSKGNEGLSVRGEPLVERRAGRLQSRLIPPGSPYGDPQSQAAGRGGQEDPEGGEAALGRQSRGHSSSTPPHARAHSTTAALTSRPQRPPHPVSGKVSQDPQGSALDDKASADR